MGETGDVPPGSTVVKTSNLTPGTYVMFCNIDDKTDGTVLNHFTRGMATTVIAVSRADRHRYCRPTRPTNGTGVLTSSRKASFLAAVV